jgi:hypothetical protein
MKNNITVGDIFTVSKTDSRFVPVKFTYPDGSIWDGCFPMYYPPMSIQFDRADIEQHLLSVYDQLSPNLFDENLKKTKKRWPKGTTSETYNVFESLLSGQWECRSCGAGKINDQPAARIRDIKKNGFIIATQSKDCATCRKKQYHDILLPFEVTSETRPEFRKPIPEAMRQKIFEILGHKDAFFGSLRPNNEFVIDHKFPSQRWEEAESDNDQLNDQEIRNKFQLLTNQSNMLKSRLCDNCCKTNKRPDFLGIKWFYSGDEDWKPSAEIGNGCYGCPWFDLEEWKQRIGEQLD